MVAAQIAEFAGCVYAGIVVGILFRLFNGIIKLFKCKKTATVILDLLYSLISLAIVSVALYYLCYGELHLYHFLGLMLGVGVLVTVTG